MGPTESSTSLRVLVPVLLPHKGHVALLFCAVLMQVTLYRLLCPTSTVVCSAPGRGRAGHSNVTRNRGADQIVPERTAGERGKIARGDVHVGDLKNAARWVPAEVRRESLATRMRRFQVEVVQPRGG